MQARIREQFEDEGNSKISQSGKINPFRPTTQKLVSAALNDSNQSNFPTSISLVCASRAFQHDTKINPNPKSDLKDEFVPMMKLRLISRGIPLAS